MKDLISTLTNRTPVPYSSSRSGGRGGLNVFGLKQNNREAQLEQMGAVSTLFAIVDVLSNAVSQVDWKLYRKQDGRGKIAGPEARKEVTDHLALRVWNKPNKFYTRQELVETCQQHFELTGEGWVLNTLNMMNWPEELWPVRPDKMHVVPSVEEFIAGYYYQAPDGDQVPLDTNEVMMMKRPDPMNMFRGLGQVQSLMRDLYSVQAAAEWNKNFFLNSAEPGGIIQFDKNLSDHEFRKFRERWNENHKGINKAHRVAILEIGKWIGRSFTMKDMQFVELRGLSREIIREAYQMNKFILGLVDDVNLANALAADVTFLRWLLKPRLERWKGMLNNDFLPRFGPTGEGLEFDYCSPMPHDPDQENKDRDSKVEAWVKLVQQGVSPEAASDLLGLPRLEMREISAPTAEGIVQALAHRLDQHYAEQRRING